MATIEEGFANDIALMLILSKDRPTNEISIVIKWASYFCYWFGFLEHRENTVLMMLYTLNSLKSGGDLGDEFKGGPIMDRAPLPPKKRAASIITREEVEHAIQLAEKYVERQTSSGAGSSKDFRSSEGPSPKKQRAESSTEPFGVQPHSKGIHPIGPAESGQELVPEILRPSFRLKESLVLYAGEVTPTEKLFSHLVSYVEKLIQFQMKSYRILKSYRDLGKKTHQFCRDIGIPSLCFYEDFIFVASIDDDIQNCTLTNEEFRAREEEVNLVDNDLKLLTDYLVVVPDVNVDLKNLRERIWDATGLAVRMGMLLKKLSITFDGLLVEISKIVPIQVDEISIIYPSYEPFVPDINPIPQDEEIDD